MHQLFTLDFLVTLNFALHGQAALLNLTADVLLDFTRPTAHTVAAQHIQHIAFAHGLAFQHPPLHNDARLRSLYTDHARSRH